MITVSPEFEAAQFADSAQPIFQINLVLGNYASSGSGATITSSGDDASGNYPAAGAIDGDQTEINIGAASTSDNGVGKSSWKSSATPTSSAPVWLQIVFSNSAQVFNRVKIYNLSTDALTSYALQYWNGTAWVTFAGTPDQFLPTNSAAGWGYGVWGQGPWGGPGNGGWPGLGYTGELDVYDFADITASKIQLLVYATKNADPAQVVEIMVYRKVDITSRTTGFKIDRKKDFKLANPIATTCDIQVTNTDQFFSFSYTPTTTQVTAGYVNSEIGLLGFDIEVNEGFQTSLGNELIRTFTGNADSVTINAKAATAEIQGRDYLKHLINQVDSCNLQLNINLSVGTNPVTGITGCLQYLLNRNGISNYEMNLFETGITLDYFFVFETQLMTTIQQLVQAAGDSIFYFDENGYATFQYYLGATPNSGTGFENGTDITDIDTYRVSGNIFRRFMRVDDFVDGDYTNNPTWTVLNSAGTTISVIGVYLTTGGNVDPGHGQPMISVPVETVRNTGIWHIDVSSTTTGQVANYYIFLDSNSTNGLGAPTGNGYALTMDFTSTDTAFFSFEKIDAGSGTTLISGSVTEALADLPTFAVNITRTPTGLWTLSVAYFIFGVPIWVTIGTATDTTYTTSKYLMIGGFNAQFSNIYWGADYTQQDSLENKGINTFESQTIDQGTVTPLVEGLFSATSSVYAGETITFYTRTSPDGSTWSAWAPVADGATIPSPAQRYIQFRCDFSAAGTTNNNIYGEQSVVYSVTLNWSSGSGQQKYSTSVAFTLTDDNAILDAQETISDNLGGDSAIINDVAVTSAPLVLGGTNSQTMWQGVAGAPPSAISTSNPLNVSVGTYTYVCLISGGMDTSKMVSGAAIAMTLGTATATAAITYVHPTKPVLTVTVTAAGTITDLRLVGQNFSNIQTPYQSPASDLASIQKHKNRHQDISNNFIVNQGIAGIIATRTISNFKSPASYIPKLSIMPKLNMQAGDQIEVIDSITGIATNYYVIGYSRNISVSGKSASAKMSLVLMLVPAA